MVKSNVKNQNFIIDGISVAPGTRTSVQVEIAKLYTHSSLCVTAEVLHGTKPGPVLLIHAAIHGDELNGVEVVRQIIESVNPKTLHGTLIAIPVVNVFGFTQKSRYLPDRRDLNRCFPGSEKGSIAGRLAYHFFERIVRYSTHIIDMHTAAIYRTNLPQIRACLSKEETKAMAIAFGSPVIIDSAFIEGSLRAEAEKIGIPVLTYEGGEALRFEPFAINAGVKGIKQIMQHLGMTSSNKKRVIDEPIITKSTRWVRAESDGIFRSQVALGDRVEKDQVIALISSPSGAYETQITAPQEGIVIGQQTLPLVNEGDAIFHIAFFKEFDKLVEEQVEEYLDDIIDCSSELKCGVGISE